MTTVMPRTRFALPARPLLCFLIAGFLLIGTTSARGDILADSTSDFSSAQGSKNWKYGYFAVNKGPGGQTGAGSFIPLPFYDSTNFRWQQQATCCPPWIAVRAYSEMSTWTPANAPQQWPVREWTSTFTGPVLISLKVQRLSPVGGTSDGIVARIYRNGRELPAAAISIKGDDFNSKLESVQLNDLSVNEILDFAIDPNDSDSNDYTYFSITVSSASTNVTVDFGAPKKVISAAGFLHGISVGGNPPVITPPVDTTIGPLSPRFWRIPADPALYQAVRSFSFAKDIPIHLILSDVYGYPDPNNPSLWKPPSADFGAYETWVQSVAQQFKYAANVYFDVWNEPDMPRFWPSTQTQEQFWQTYQHAYKALSDVLGSSVRVAGPSYSYYNRTLIQQFLDSCLNQNLNHNPCQVASLTWHAGDTSFGAAELPGAVPEARMLFQQAPYMALNIARIDINEILDDVAWRQPGGTLNYFASFEQSGADAAARSCGFPTNLTASSCYSGILDGLLNSDLQPGGAWWLQKYYADGVASRVSSSSVASSVAVLANSSPSPSLPPQILIGNFYVPDPPANVAATANLQLTLKNVTAVTSANPIGLRVQAISETQASGFVEPSIIYETTALVSSGNAVLSLSNFPLAPGAAFRITFAQPQSISFPSLPDVALGAQPLVLSPAASSGLTVTLNSSTPAVCDFFNKTLSILTPGTCTLNSSQAGNDFYLAAPGVTRSFQVSVVGTAPVIAGRGASSLYSLSGIVQPGSWTSIQGGNLAPGAMQATAAMLSTGAFPTSMLGVTVTMDGKPGFLLYVSPTLINVQVPDIPNANGRTINVTVTTPSGSYTSQAIVAAVSPSFSRLGDGRHVAGIILRGGTNYDILGPAGNSLGFSTVPAKAGDIVEIFGVGFGPTTPSIPAGQVYSGAAPTDNPVSLTIGGVTITPKFAGISSAGLYQFNVLIPSGLPSGDQPLTATMAGVQTPTGVVISLQ
jgi:uncharacterized protein (TIGR03437 family)